MPSLKESSLTEPFFCRRDGLLLEAALSAPVAAGSCHHLKLDNPAADAAGPQFKRVALPLSLPAHRTRNTASNSSSPPPTPAQQISKQPAWLRSAAASLQLCSSWLQLPVSLETGRSGFVPCSTMLPNIPGLSRVPRRSHHNKHMCRLNSSQPRPPGPQGTAARQPSILVQQKQGAVGRQLGQPWLGQRSPPAAARQQPGLSQWSGRQQQPSDHTAHAGPQPQG